MLAHTVVILAMTADGKIADHNRHAARFGSEVDKSHLETQIALADAVLFAAGTLRAYGTSLPISNPELLALRNKQGKPPQPIHIVCSASGDINPQLRFFSQPIPRWLLTTNQGAKFWLEPENHQFDQVLISENNEHQIDWLGFWQKLSEFKLNRIAILGGGQLVASLLELNLINEIFLTICPVILGGEHAPTPVEGRGFTQEQLRRLQLISVKQVNDEVFLHYTILPTISASQKFV